MNESYRGTGVTENTVKNLMLGAGTIHKGLKLISGKWNFEESLVGATSGGNKLTITPNIFTPEIDNVLVKTKGMDFKQGETAQIEINFAEITSELIKTSVIGEIKKSEASGFSLIESKPDISAGDYWDNIAFVGQKTDGTNIIVILDNALCTSGLELDAKNKDTAKPKLIFECTQEPNGDTRVLPYHIYYPAQSQSEEINTENLPEV